MTDSVAAWAWAAIPSAAIAATTKRPGAPRQGTAEHAYSVRCSSSFALLVSAANPACSQSFTPAAASVQVRIRPNRGASTCVALEPGCDPGADAARARHELADRLPHVAGLDGSSSPPCAWPSTNGSRMKLVTSSLRDRARRLERRGAEDREVERGVLARVAVERAREGARDRETADEGADMISA